MAFWKRVDRNEAPLKPMVQYKAPKGISARSYGVQGEMCSDTWAIAVISFHGAMPDGSAGKDHAEFVTLECVKVMTRLDAKCLIIDFRDVKYRWGNGILSAFQVLDRYFFYEWQDVDMRLPIKVLASDKSIGLRSLLKEETFFETMEEAIQSCGEDMKRWAED